VEQLINNLALELSAYWLDQVQPNQIMTATEVRARSDVWWYKKRKEAKQ